MLLPSRTAVCPCTAAGIAGVDVQVLVPEKSSADESAVEPSLPPATRTCPFAMILAGNRVAVCPHRGDVIVPAVDQDPGPTPGSKIAVVFSVIDPFLPPVTSTLPFASVVIVCSSRAA